MRTTRRTIDKNKENIDTAKKLMPRGLPADEKAIWLRLAPISVSRNCLSEPYVVAFQELCEIRARMDRNRKQLDLEGWTYTTDGRHGQQRKQNPLVAIFNEDSKRFLRLMASFALTPSSTKALGSAIENFIDDDFDDF